MRFPESLKPIIGGITVLALTYVAAFFSIFLLSKEALIALVQGEAVVFGFFGLMVVYVLEAYDDKLGRLDQLLFEMSETGKDQEKVPGMKEPKGEFIAKLKGTLRSQRKRTIRSASVTGLLLVISMIMSIWLIGAMDLLLQIGFANPLGSIVILLDGIDVLLFFLSVWFLFDLFRDLAKESWP